MGFARIIVVAIAFVGRVSIAATAASGAHTDSVISSAIINAIATTASGSAELDGRTADLVVGKGSRLRKRKEIQPLKAPESC